VKEQQRDKDVGLGKDSKESDEGVWIYSVSRQAPHEVQGLPAHQAFFLERLLVVEEFTSIGHRLGKDLRVPAYRESPSLFQSHDSFVLLDVDGFNAPFRLDRQGNDGGI
jgi:hypothetical protein